MLTEGNERNNRNKILNEEFLNNKFISYINTLSDSIREYFKVSINIIQNKQILINTLEGEIFSSYPNLIQNNDSIKIKDILDKLKINIDSGNKNLLNFVEDAKIIFKKMREYQNLMKNKIIKQRSYADYPKKINRTISPYNGHIQHSAYNFSIGNDINSFINRKKIIKKNNVNNLIPFNNVAKIKNENQRNQNQETIERSSISENTQRNSQLLEEIEKLKKMNKNYELGIKKYKLEMQKLKNENNNKMKNNDMNIQDELLQNKDTIISSLKNDIEKSNIKNQALVKDLKNLKNQNESLKGIILSDRKQIMKLNNTIQENNKLITSMDFPNSSNINSRKNLYANINSELINLKKDNNLLRNKIITIENQLKEEIKKNENLKKENMLLVNNHKSELSKLSKGNNELSKDLLNKQKELLNLQKENIDKSKEIENLKLSILSKENEEKQNLLQSIKTIFDKENENSSDKHFENLSESVRKIFENYKKENYQLKESQNNFKEKIKNLQEQLANTQNELIENNEINIERVNKNQKQINDLANNFNIKIEESNNEKKNIINRLYNLQNIYNELMIEKEDFIKRIAAKDIKIMQLQSQNVQYKEDLDKLNNIKLSNRILEEKNESNIQSKCIELYKQLNEEKHINNELNDELKQLKSENEKLKNKLLSLGYNYIAGEEVKISRDQVLEELNNKIEKLEEKNANLNEMVETFTNKYLSNINIQKENKEEIKNNVNENALIEELQQKNIKYEDEINLLKKENNKFKEQIIRLSTDLPKEYDELQKQYNDLKNKYKQSLKNDKNNNTDNKNINNFTNNEEKDKIMKELQEIKKENEQIKKKNMDLISQLEEKEIKRNYFDNKSEDKNLSNYEEEFDLKKMAKGAKEKNKSQDLNIDYPGIQNIKEKYRELDFYYNSLEALVKKLLSTIQVNPKNKTYVAEICKLVGFDLETTNKNLNNKNKKLLLGLFPK